MKNIPRVPAMKSVFSLWRNGYEFISKECQRLQSDVFTTKLGTKRYICMQGEEAAKIFYDTEKFTRVGAAPKFVQKTLFGEGGVQGLDGAQHRHRKELFMSFMAEENVEKLKRITNSEFENYLSKWEAEKQVVLFNDFNEIIFQSVCRWAGIPFTDGEVASKTKAVSNMIEGPATLGIRHWRARKSRKEIETWIQKLVENARKETSPANRDSVLYKMTWHRDKEGRLLDKEIVAVEIINIIRPTLAVGRYWTFAALALHKYPEYRKKIQHEGDAIAECFSQEVRRFYPFFPFTTAIVRKDFEWRNYSFNKGSHVFLDLYGTNRHRDLWEEPDKFTPERFLQWKDNPYNFIPQGGGNHNVNHRCAGEKITIELLKLAVKVLATDMKYIVPKQDLSIDKTRFPAIPKSRMMIQRVKRQHRTLRN
jgi:fatty-acid peroxygenase